MPYEDDSGSSSSSDEDDRRERRERKKEKKEKKSKHKSKKDKKDKKKKDKKDKKDKKEKASKGKHPEFGKYGILGPQDRYHKQQEFYAWLREVKELNPENQPPAELASLFSDFAEDFNTVTLPHKKYYNLEGWEAKQAKKRKAEDGDAAPAAYSIVDDERALQSRHTKRNKIGMSREELLEMQRITRERAQANVKKDLGQKVDEKAGVRTKSVMRGLVAPGTKTV